LFGRKSPGAYPGINFLDTANVHSDGSSEEIVEAAADGLAT